MSKSLLRKCLQLPVVLLALMVLGLILAIEDAAEAQPPASALAYEPFDLDPGQLRDHGSGFGWLPDSAWAEASSGATVTTGSLAYPAGTSAATPVGNKACHAGPNQAAARRLDPSVFGTSGTVYISFLLNPGDSPTKDGKDMQLQFGGGFTDYHMGILNGGNYGISSSATSSDTGIAAVPNQTVLLVAKYDLDADRVDLFVNPGPTEPTTPDTSLSADLNVKAFRIFHSASPAVPNQCMDEILYGDSYSAVVELGNQPPDCSNATPNESTLWPPNHQFVSIDVTGVTDPDGDTVSITIDSIFQDELVNGENDGNTSPDGQGVGTATAEVRAERAGDGNGRVYEIGYTADDGQGGNCTGSVFVEVPPNMKNTAVNDGTTINSNML